MIWIEQRCTMARSVAFTSSGLRAKMGMSGMSRGLQAKMGSSQEQKIGKSREQKSIWAENKNEYGQRTKLSTSWEQKCVGAESSHFFVTRHLFFIFFYGVILSEWVHTQCVSRTLYILKTQRVTKDIQIGLTNNKWWSSDWYVQQPEHKRYTSTKHPEDFKIHQSYFSHQRHSSRA